MPRRLSIDGILLFPFVLSAVEGLRDIPVGSQVFTISGIAEETCVPRLI
jgi:hypothetical protein